MLHILYPQAFWREKGFSGEVLSYGGGKVERGCDAGPISATYDATTYRGHPAIVGFMASKSGVQWNSKDVSCVSINIAVEWLALLLYIQEAVFHISDWRLAIPTEVFDGFSQSLQADVGIVPSTRPCALPSTFFSIY